MKLLGLLGFFFFLGLGSQQAQGQALSHEPEAGIMLAQNTPTTSSAQAQEPAAATPAVKAVPQAGRQNKPQRVDEATADESMEDHTARSARPERSARSARSSRAAEAGARGARSAAGAGAGAGRVGGAGRGRGQ
ncbi:hypothetical protein GCM10023185_24980 [Hymenobacter saemangeumensis]|uniref:Translation initiation factor IF-2 n=1 Tax=Hymenobacter saemangeumensis TaxID=1084522 RepID=A0ABP8IHE9_9BACT